MMSSPAESGASRNARGASRGKGDPITALIDLGGFSISDCAFASAAAKVPILLLACCTRWLLLQELKADGAGFRPLGPHPMSRRLLRVVGHEGFQLCLG